ncbi:MAG: 30S ribosomal protein S6 [Candidatus Paceibacterota bacterium]|jgi:small subunit ribosomal protein S6
MAAYELTLILKPELTDEAVDTLIDKLGVDVTGRQKLGKRMLSYPIKKQKEGTYVLCDVTAKTDKMKALDQLLRINESIIRYLLIEKTN